ncbi:MAG: hypothetical protein WD423_11745 [Rhodothermales bacterium]
MDYEVELNYRLTGHLDSNETVLATLISIQHGIYAATDRRILCLNNDDIGYRLRIHPYESLDRVEFLAEDGAWFVQFTSGVRVLMVRARSEREAERFVEAVTKVRHASVAAGSSA